MQPEENPFHALIEAEMVLARFAVAQPFDDRTKHALKLVRSALQYLRTHPIGEYVDPKVNDARD